MRERVVITGIGCISCFGVGHRPFAEALIAGMCGVEPIAAFDTSACRSHRAAMLQGFDPAAFIAPKLLRRVDQVGRLAIACTHGLLRDAGCVPNPDGTDEIGVALGTFSAGVDSTVEYLRGFAEHGPAGVPALLFSNTVSNAAASLCAIEFGLRGPNVTFNQREASSLCALAFSIGAVRDGRIRAMVTGGADRIDETFFKVHDRFHALSPMRVGSDETARPFDRRRNGFVFGEGGFSVLVESETAARERGARIYGEILGLGMTASRTELNQWAADPDGLTRAMHLALADAGLAPDRIDAVYATANGSPHLDALEAVALATVFGDRPVPTASLKGAIGENSSGGAAGVVAGLLTLSQGAIVPTVGFAESDPVCAVNVSTTARRSDGDTFLVNSVASGGTNCALVVRCLAHA
jgi:3-oxoacyl-[acyl-carrier-protein] synthase II